MVKVRSKEEMYEFIQKWKNLDISFKGKTIRARTDKTPEQRMGNKKTFKMSEHSKGVFIDKCVDLDFKHFSVWVGDCEVVKWDPQAARLNWQEEDINKAGLTIDRDSAEPFAAEE